MIGVAAPTWQAPMQVQAGEPRAVRALVGLVGRAVVVPAMRGGRDVRVRPGSGLDLVVRTRVAGQQVANRPGEESNDHEDVRPLRR